MPKSTWLVLYDIDVSLSCLPVNYLEVRKVQSV